MVGRRQNEAGWPALLAGTAIAVWGWRLELVLAALLVLAQRLLVGLLGERAAAVLVAVLLGVVLAVGAVRRFAWRAVRAAWVRRAWRRAVGDVGMAVDALRAPRVLEVRRIAAGDVLRVRVCRGQSVATFGARAAELAACLRGERIDPELAIRAARYGARADEERAAGRGPCAWAVRGTWLVRCPFAALSGKTLRFAGSS